MSYIVSTNYLYKKVVELSYTVTELYWRSALLASSFPLEVEVISILLAFSSFHELEVSFLAFHVPHELEASLTGLFILP
jgi:hypothetical protein